MKFLLSFFIIAISLTTSVFAQDLLQSNQIPAFTAIEAKKLSSEGTVFPVSDGEANVEGELLKRIEIGQDNVVFTLKNKTSQPISPKFNVKFYNRYGMLLDEEIVTWLFDKVSPSDVRKEEKSIFIPNFEKIFKYSDLSIPSDAKLAIFAVVSGEKW